jgi:hypothetical protein
MISPYLLQLSGSGSGSGEGSGVYLAKIYNEWFEISGQIENSLCNNLPEHLFHFIDREFVKKVDNLESFRTLREKIGVDKSR